MRNNIKKRDRVRLVGDVSRRGRVRRVRPFDQIALVVWTSGSPKREWLSCGSLDLVYRKGVGRVG